MSSLVKHKICGAPYIWKEEHGIPGQDKNTVVGCEADKNTVSRALHLWPTEDEDGYEVSDESEDPHDVEHDSGHQELKVDAHTGVCHRLVVAFVPCLHGWRWTTVAAARLSTTRLLSYYYITTTALESAPNISSTLGKNWSYLLYKNCHCIVLNYDAAWCMPCMLCYYCIPGRESLLCHRGTQQASNGILEDCCWMIVGSTNCKLVVASSNTITT